MNKRTIEALRRCDRALAGAFLLVLVTVVAHAALVPHTDRFDRPAPQAEAAVQQPAASDPNLVAVAARPAPAEIAAAQLLAERRCLAEAMYYEARGEGTRGEMAVAEVVFHRMRSGAYPNSICGVVFEGAQEKRACQFSFVCNGDMERAKNPHAWSHARLLAAKIMTGGVRLGDMTDDATSYHAVSVDPVWAATLVKTVQIGNHVFYRRPSSRTRGS